MPGSEPTQPDDHRQRERANEQRDPLRLPKVGDEVPDLREEVPGPVAYSKQLWQLADHDRQRQADDEALEHRLADEVGQEAEAQQSRDQGGDADDERQPGRERGEVAVSRRRDVRDNGRRQGRGRCNRRDDEYPRAAQGGVEQECAWGGVEADDRRHPGDARVRECLGDEDRPDREAGDQIAAKPPAL